MPRTSRVSCLRIGDDVLHVEIFFISELQPTCYTRRVSLPQNWRRRAIRVYNYLEDKNKMHDAYPLSGSFENRSLGQFRRVDTERAFENKSTVNKLFHTWRKSHSRRFFEYLYKFLDCNLLYSTLVTLSIDTLFLSSLVSLQTEKYKFHIFKIVQWSHGSLLPNDLTIYYYQKKSSRKEGLTLRLRTTLTQNVPCVRKTFPHITRARTSNAHTRSPHEIYRSWWNESAKDTQTLIQQNFPIRYIQRSIIHYGRT